MKIMCGDIWQEYKIQDLMLVAGFEMKLGLDICVGSKKLKALIDIH